MSGDGDVGYGKPPKSTRFRRGRSGNPKGRPRGRRKEPPYETVLGQMVTIREDGTERRVTAEEAFLLQMAKQGLKKGGATARIVVETLEAVRGDRDAADDAAGAVLKVVEIDRWRSPAWPSYRVMRRGQ